MGTAGAFSLDQASGIRRKTCMLLIATVSVVAYGTRWPRVRPYTCNCL
jgi:hypothetical protein